MKTRYNEDDLEYNREFQRMNYLSEPARKKPGHRELELNVLDLGGDVKLNKPLKDIKKKSPHYKYF